MLLYIIPQGGPRREGGRRAEDAGGGEAGPGGVRGNHLSNAGSVYNNITQLYI